MNQYFGSNGPLYLAIAANVLLVGLGLYIKYLLITFLRLGINYFRKYLK